jgi:hypothetical protein
MRRRLLWLLRLRQNIRMHNRNSKKAQKVNERHTPGQQHAQEQRAILGVIVRVPDALHDAAEKRQEDGVVKETENVPAGFGSG